MNTGNMFGSGHMPIGPEDDVTLIVNVVPLVIFIVAIVVITGVSVGLGCWCYHHIKIKRERHCLSGRGGVTALSNNLKCDSNEGRLVVNTSLLDSVKVYKFAVSD